MSSFDDRQKGEEAKFAHDAQLRFKAEARRNKHLAHWACDLMGEDGADAKAEYTAEIIAADMASAGTEDVLQKLKGDFDAKGVAVAEADIRAKIAEFDALARQQVLAEG